MRAASRRRAAFTLIEMLGVLFLVSLVLSQSVSFYFDISERGLEATERARDARRGAAVLDRVARDLQNTRLVVKPGEVDPLDHPWLFRAEEERGEVGATQLKFVTQNAEARSSTSEIATFTVVEYGLRDDEEGRLSLWRRATPWRPDEVHAPVVLDESQGAQLLVENVAAFGVRLLGEDGAWRERWDSSLLADASQLPLAAEIGLTLRSGDPQLPEPGGTPEQIRRVRLPMPPIDLAALLAAEPGTDAAEEEEEREGCVTLLECLAEHPELSGRSDVVDLLEADPEAAGACLTDLGLSGETLQACL